VCEREKATQFADCICVVYESVLALAIVCEGARERVCESLWVFVSVCRRRCMCVCVCVCACVFRMRE